MQPLTNETADTKKTAPLSPAEVTDEQAWFDAPSSRRLSTVPPPPTERLGDFLGDELADAWLR